jgi:hypothetical protein
MSPEHYEDIKEVPVPTEPVAAMPPHKSSTEPTPSNERAQYIPGHYFIKFKSEVMDDANAARLSELVNQLKRLGFNVQESPMARSYILLRGLHHLNVDAAKDEEMYGKLLQFNKEQNKYIDYTDRFPVISFDQTLPK